MKPWITDVEGCLQVQVQVKAPPLRCGAVKYLRGKLVARMQPAGSIRHVDSIGRVV